MGEFISCLMNVSPGYNTYLFAICDKYGNKSERIFNELFQQIAEDIGIRNVVVKPFGGAVREAERVFGIKRSMKRPVLVITDCHPLALLKYRNMAISDKTKDQAVLKKRIQEVAITHPEITKDTEMGEEFQKEVKESDGGAYLIEFGNIEDEERIRRFLADLSRLIADEKSDKIKGRFFKEKVVNLLSHAGLAGLAVSAVGLFK